MTHSVRHGPFLLLNCDSVTGFEASEESEESEGSEGSEGSEVSEDSEASEASETSEESIMIPSTSSGAL